jgi:hypothetical protein
LPARLRAFRWNVPIKAAIGAAAKQKETNHDQEDNTTEKKSNRPTHTLFHVTGEGDAQNWTRIGAAWAHQDGKGFNLDVEMIPMKPGRFVVREAKPKQKGAGQ